MVEFANKVQIDVHPYQWVNIYASQEYDRTRVNITINQEIVDTVEWFKKYKVQLEQEAKIRAENPAVASQYEQYQALFH